MILVTRLNRTETFWVNEDRIEFIETTPDTLITLESGRKFTVAETAEEMVKLIDTHKRELLEKKI